MTVAVHATLKQPSCSWRDPGNVALRPASPHGSSSGIVCHIVAAWTAATERPLKGRRFVSKCGGNTRSEGDGSPGGVCGGDGGGSSGRGAGGAGTSMRMPTMRMCIDESGVLLLASIMMTGPSKCKSFTVCWHIATHSSSLRMGLPTGFPPILKTMESPWSRRALSAARHSMTTPWMGPSIFACHVAPTQSRN